MRKKEFYLDYKAKQKKRMFYSKKEPREHKTRGKIAVMIFLLAILMGAGACFLSLYQEEKEANKQKIKENQIVISQIEEIDQQTTSGPYGMWISKPLEEEEIVEVIEDKEVWMSGFVDTREVVNSKGIYVTATGANKNIDHLIELLESSELNTMVIDIKDDDGYITYRMDYDQAIAIKATTSYITDIEGLIKKLKEKNIYAIARVVTFKDPVLAERRPELALKYKDGSTFRDKDKQAWVNPYKKEVWDYIIGVAKECANIGFDEVNFDYIRFSTDSGMSKVDFGEEAETKTKIETVTEFVKYACEQLKPLGIFVSADVYGAIISSSIDAKIVGQSYVEMSKYLDYICPMIYPSHYGDGYYGIDYPDTQPYELIMGALKSSRNALDQIDEDEHCAVVRPWLQDFTASWLRHYIKYGPNEVREQIEAVYNSEYTQWLLWNGAMNYTKDALYTEEEADYRYANRPTPTPTPTPTPEPLPTRIPNSGQYFDSPWKN